MRRATLFALFAAAGCGGGSAGMSPTAGAPMGTPTWHQDVAPLVARSCTGCHRQGGIAPFSLTDYASARPFAGSMALRVQDQTMPPWGAFETPECKPRLPWAHDLRLSEAEKAIIKGWAAAGAPEGTASRAAKLPDPVRLDLASPTMRMTVARPFVAGGTRDQFRCFPLPYKFDQDVWITGLQVVPGNNALVHHVVVYLDENDQAMAKVGPDGSFECFGAPGVQPVSLLGAWAPGATPLEAPGGVGIQVKKGARVVLNVHYHPNGRAGTDQTSIDVRWTTTKPEWQGVFALIGNSDKFDPKTGDGLQPGPGDPPGGPAFVIPANAKGHVVSQRFTLPTMPQALVLGGRLWAVGTHMHYVGTDMRIAIDRRKRLGGNLMGDPMQECLLQTPRWDFSWQRGYGYDAPLENLPSVRAGDVLELRCTYDNTMGNPHVQQALAEQGLSAPRDVRLGEQTLDEMCLGAFGIAFRAP